MRNYRVLKTIYSDKTRLELQVSLWEKTWVAYFSFDKCHYKTIYKNSILSKIFGYEIRVNDAWKKFKKDCDEMNEGSAKEEEYEKKKTIGIYP